MSGSDRGPQVSGGAGVEGSQDNRSASLNESQIRSMGVVLRSIEEALDEIEASLKAGAKAHILYRVINPYGEAEQRELREVIARIREALCRCRDRWRLPVQSRRVDAEVNAYSSILWADLEECRPEKMRRYGAVPEALRGDLEEDVEALSGLIVLLGDIHKNGALHP